MPTLTEMRSFCFMLLLVAYEDCELGGSAGSPGCGSRFGLTHPPQGLRTGDSVPA